MKIMLMSMSTFTQMNHPLAMGLILQIQTVLVSLITCSVYYRKRFDFYMFYS